MYISRAKTQAATWRAGLNYARLAEKAGITRATVSKGINGKSVSLSSVRAMADALKVTVNDLLDEDRIDEV